MHTIPRIDEYIDTVNAAREIEQDFLKGIRFVLEKVVRNP